MEKLSYTSLVKRASLLRLSALSIAEGMRTGSFRSMFRSQGVEFSGVREYLAGDDIRAIDWNVTARSNKPFVKIFDEERELIVFMVVDRSLSMETGTGSCSRLQTACETGALLGFAAHLLSCPVGGVFFSSKITASYTPKTGKDSMMLLLQELDTQNSTNAQGSALNLALRGAHKLLKNRSLTVVISDFRTTDYETDLAQLAIKHDVIAILVTDPSDFELHFSITMPFTDPETKIKRTLATHSSSFKRQWKQEATERIARWTALCRKRGVTPLVISTEDDPAQVLAHFFNKERF